MFRDTCRVFLTAAAVSAAAAALWAKDLKVNAPAPLPEALREDFLPVIEKAGGGQIDWTAGEVTAVGTARVQGKGSSAMSMANRAARLIAARNAAMLVAGVRPGPGGRFGNVKAGKIEVDAILKHFRQVQETHDPKAGTVTARIVMPLYGAQGVAAFVGVAYDKSPKRWDWPNEAAGEGTDVVIIDARGSGFLPSMAPRVVDRLGRCVLEGGDLTTSPEHSGPAVAYVAFQGSPADGGGENIPPPGTRAKARARSAAEMASKAALERERLLREGEHGTRGGAAKTPSQAKPAVPTRPRTLADAVRNQFRAPLILQGGGVLRESPQTLVLSDAAVRTLAQHPEAQAPLHACKVVIVVK